MSDERFEMLLRDYAEGRADERMSYNVQVAVVTIGATVTSALFVFARGLERVHGWD